MGWKKNSKLGHKSSHILSYLVLITQPVLNKPLMKADIWIFHSYAYKDNRLFGAV